MFKLSDVPCLITVTRAERQNVRLAAELLSHTTAVNLRRHFGEHNEAILLAEIIEIIDKWFDVMNSRQLHQGVPGKSGYGSNLPLQNKALDDMVFLMTAFTSSNSSSGMLEVYLDAPVKKIKAPLSLLRKKKNNLYIG